MNPIQPIVFSGLPQNQAGLTFHGRPFGMPPDRADGFELRFSGTRGQAEMPPWKDNLERMQHVISMLLGEFQSPMSWGGIERKLDFIASPIMETRPEMQAAAHIYQNRFALLVVGHGFAEWDQILDGVGEMKKMDAEARESQFDGYCHFFSDKDAIKDLMLNLLHPESPEEMSWTDLLSWLDHKKHERFDDWQNKSILSAISGTPYGSNWDAIASAAGDIDKRPEFEDLLRQGAEKLRAEGHEVDDNADFGRQLDVLLESGFFDQ